MDYERTTILQRILTSTSLFASADSKPVQRLLKYPLLITQILQLTEAEFPSTHSRQHPDLPNILPMRVS